MNKLRAPLKSWLDTALPEEQLQRMWRELGHAQRPRWHWTLFGAGLAFGVCAAVWLASGWLSNLRHEGPIRIAGSAPLVAAESLGADHPRELSLDDGSHIALASAAQLEVLENNAHSLVLQLRRGKSAFDVNPGGPRRWLIECGPASVEVVGTRFDVERDERGVRVSVTRGVVLVRAPELPNGAARVRAGQSVVVHEQPGRAVEGARADNGGESVAHEDGRVASADREAEMRARSRAAADDVSAANLPRARAMSRTASTEAAAISGRKHDTTTSNSDVTSDRSHASSSGADVSSRRSEPAADSGRKIADSPAVSDAGGRQPEPAVDRARSHNATASASALPSRMNPEVHDGRPTSIETSAAARPVPSSPSAADGGASTSAADAGNTAELEHWLDDADQARRQHEAARAEALLRRVIAAAPHSAHAALAAFTLARMQLPDEPAAASASLELALSSALPAGLREDALALQIEAWARAGQRSRARAAAQAYLGRYPHGRHRDAVSRWTAPR